jgi:hypothetical protein
MSNALPDDDVTAPKHVGAVLMSILIWILKLFLRQFTCASVGELKKINLYVWADSVCSSYFASHCAVFLWWNLLHHLVFDTVYLKENIKVWCHVYVTVKLLVVFSFVCHHVFKDYCLRKLRVLGSNSCQWVSTNVMKRKLWEFKDWK